MDRTSTGAGGSRHGAGPLAPLRALSLRTAPPLLVYLVAGASGFASIAETFWVRERLGLSAADLLALSAWLTVPWTLKMVFGHLVDTVPVFGSRRRAYVLAGALLHAAAYLALAAAAAGRTGRCRGRPCTSRRRSPPWSASSSRTAWRTR